MKEEVAEQKEKPNSNATPLSEPLQKILDKIKNKDINNHLEMINTDCQKLKFQ